jgi:hypothetical protein
MAVVLATVQTLAGQARRYCSPFPMAAALILKTALPRQAAVMA